MKYLVKISLILSALLLSGVAYANTDNPIIKSFTASPLYPLNAGEQITLSWTSQYSTDCNIRGGQLNADFGSSGNTSDYPRTSTTYTITCNNSSSDFSDSRSIKIFVNNPNSGGNYYNSQPNYSGIPSINFYSNKSVITSGEQITLSWSTSNAVSCYGTGGFSGYKNIAGSEISYPDRTTTYSLTCYNSYGSNTSKLTIYANGVDQNYSTQPSSNAVSVACATSPDSPKTGQTITFAAAASGGSQPYSFTWSGAVFGTGETIDTTFSTSGFQSALVTVRDSAGRTGHSSCDINISSTPAQTASSADSSAGSGKVQGATVVCKQVTVCFDQNSGKIVDSPASGTSVSPTPTPAKSAVKNDSKSAPTSFLATIFNVKGDVWGKIKSLAIWYVVILLVIVLIVLVYMGAKKIKNKKQKDLEEAAQQSARK